MRALGAEFARVDLLLVDAGRGRVWVQVERVPGRGEFVGWVGGLVCADGGLQAAQADVAPWADCVAGDGDGVVGHSCEGWSEGQGAGGVVVGDGAVCEKSEGGEGVYLAADT